MLMQRDAIELSKEGFSCHPEVFEQVGICEECFPRHLKEKEVSCFFVVEEIVDRGRWAGQEISFDDQVRENSEMGFYSSFTSPPTSLYLYLKQVHARTKNSSLFLTTDCLFCGFF